jgi:hypothetical protein
LLLRRVAAPRETARYADTARRASQSLGAACGAGCRPCSTNPKDADRRRQEKGTNTPPASPAAPSHGTATKGLRRRSAGPPLRRSALDAGVPDGLVLQCLEQAFEFVGVPHADGPIVACDSNCWGGVRATRQTSSRTWGPNSGGRPPLHFGSKPANPCWLNAWITSRAYCVVAANIAAASAALRPCTEANTIPARRNRTRSRAVRVIFTSRCASAGSNSRTNTSGCRAITTSGDSLPGNHPAQLRPQRSRTRQ